ncbi:hypothetical protein AM501_09915 [Aneurinibacillus migulanus]|uniref:hypothetical protein n=1 Tax=Aneurinibacillus migulanus TaxID=47500 RepID=UPI0005C2D7A3|nr:hypothetical protein [Aneurinibacillus migulanus]KIV56460.1 hypothetical protein TS64_09330 [Aneurinibacillus migulanus]KPD08468.1 hypothetical protein AM501_09915 [Aneurinibacillus migulanus]
MSMVQKYIDSRQFRGETYRKQESSRKLLSLLYEYPDRNYSDKEIELVNSLAENSIIFFRKWEHREKAFISIKMSTDEICKHIQKLQQEKKLLTLVSFLHGTFAKMDGGIKGISVLELAALGITGLLLVRFMNSI